MNLSQWGLQESYKRAFNAVVKANLVGTAGTATDVKNATEAAQNAILSQSYLRLEQPLLTTQNILQFPVLVNASNQNNPQTATEKRLNMQDSFFASSVAVYIALRASATDTAFRLETFPNVNVFPTGAAGLETVAPLNTLYNGLMSITINKNVIIPAMSMSNFLQIPQSQRVSTTAGLQQNQFDPGQVFLMEPNLNFVGTKDNRVQIEMPAQLSAVDALTYVVIIFQGVLAQNVTLVS
jgi:hypothetical protein